MTDAASLGNPFALPGAEEPRIGRYTVNGCRLYAELRGSGPTESPPVFREIVAELTRLRRRPGTNDSRQPDSVPGVGHLLYFTPQPVADCIRRNCTALT